MASAVVPPGRLEDSIPLELDRRLDDSVLRDCDGIIDVGLVDSAESVAFALSVPSRTPQLELPSSTPRAGEPFDDRGTGITRAPPQPATLMARTARTIHRGARGQYAKPEDG